MKRLGPISSRLMNGPKMLMNEHAPPPQLIQLKDGSV